MILQNIKDGKFPEALAELNSNEKLPSGMSSSDWSQLYKKLFDNQQYEILTKLVENKMLAIDLYEFKNYLGSIFEYVARNLITDSPEAAEFLASLAKNTENKDEEVEGTSLLSYLMNTQAKPFVIKAFLENGFSANYKNRNEETLIFSVTKNNMLPEPKGAEYIKLLTEMGCEIDKPNIVKSTALMSAVSGRKKILVETLLNLGANPNEADKDGKTAYYFAVAEQLDLDMYQLLSKFQQPDLSVLTNDNVSILFEYLRIMTKSNDKYLKLLKSLLEDGADLYQVCSNRGAEMLPIDLLVQKDADAFAAALETDKVDISYRDAKGNTLLHKVCAFDVNYDQNVAKDLYRKSKILVEKGLDTSLTNDEEKTAMMLASTDNLKNKIVELLIKN